jgi:HAD superfamily hydrolase (TIGR01549 family)
MKIHERIIYSIAKHVRYVSFDIFDTLIKREVNHPWNVFDIVERLYNQWAINEGKPTINGFKMKRVCAELRAYNVAGASEISIEDIYRCYPDDEVIIEQLKNIEINTETKICHSNSYVHRIYDRLINDGTNVIIISDMYLPENAIKFILSNAGYIGYKKLYLSSTIGKTKRSRDLFMYVKSSLGISKNLQILHIGDNRKSDFLNAIRRGYLAVLIDKRQVYTNYIRKHEIYTNSNSASLLFQFINCHLSQYKEQSRMFCIGYEVFGPFLYFFTKWVINRCIQDRRAKLFFFARDCYLVEKAYEMLNQEKNIHSKYVHLSRKSIKPLYLLTKKYDLGKALTIGLHENHNGLYSLNEILTANGFAKGTILKISKECAVDEQKKVLLSQIVDNDCIQKAIAKNMDEIIASYEAFVSYINRLEFSGNVAIVDLGWRGNTQYMLQEILRNNDTNVNMIGYYFGISSPPNITNDLCAEGYWVNHENSSDMTNDANMRFVLEAINLAPEGTTESYYIDDNGIPKARLSSRAEEYCDNLVEIQGGALQFVSDFSKSSHNSLSVESGVICGLLTRFVNSPKLTDVKDIGSIEYVEGEIQTPLVCRKINRRNNSKISMIKEYEYSRWKEGYLKSVLRIPMDYNLLRRIIAIVSKYYRRRLQKSA